MKHLVSVWCGALTVGFAALLWMQLAAARPPAAAAPAVAAVMPATAKFTSIDVERINVVEPDGKPRVIVASRARSPGAIWGGVEYPHPGRAQGGVLFFNDDGTEAGGISYGNDRGDRSAGAIFTMDQYEQDQTLVLQYEEREGQRGAGLVVYDRPDKSLLPMLETYRDYQRATGAAKQRLEGKLAQLGTEMGDAAPRLFVGKQGDDALLVLSDKQGRPRLVLKVDGAGSPTIELLDGEGKVTRTMR